MIYTNIVKDLVASEASSLDRDRRSFLLLMRKGGIDLICKGSMSNVNSLGKGKADACLIVESSFVLEGNSGVPICTFDRKSKQNIKLRFIDLPHRSIESEFAFSGRNMTQKKIVRI